MQWHLNLYQFMLGALILDILDYAYESCLPLFDIYAYKDTILQSPTSNQNIFSECVLEKRQISKQKLMVSTNYTYTDYV